MFAPDPVGHCRHEETSFSIRWFRYENASLWNFFEISSHYIRKFCETTTAIWLKRMSGSQMLLARLLRHTPSPVQTWAASWPFWRRGVISASWFEMKSRHCSQSFTSNYIEINIYKMRWDEQKWIRSTSSKDVKEMKLTTALRFLYDPRLWQVDSKRAWSTFRVAWPSLLIFLVRRRQVSHCASSLTKSEAKSAVANDNRAIKTIPNVFIFLFLLNGSLVRRNRDSCRCNRRHL